MTHSPIDSTAPVRPGEELDAAALDVYLREQIPDLSGELEIEQFPGGHSNLTYLLRYGAREMVLRRPPFGHKAATAHDMGREYHILKPLVEVYPRVPRPLAFCEDEAVIGAPFYVMERLKGVIIRRQPPKGIEFTPEMLRALSENFVDNLAAIHRVDARAAGIEAGRPEGYVTRQIEGWTRRYQAARTDDIPAVERAASWLADHMPPEAGASLIHNDYKYDNLILSSDDLTQITGVLDWEMATVGCPLMDLGTSLGYWVDPDDPPALQMIAFGMTNLPGNLNRRELVQRYADQSGLAIGDQEALFYLVYGLFKVVVIAQQIYARFKSGASQDQRFAMMIEAVKVLGQTACLAIDRGRIDRLG